MIDFSAGYRLYLKVEELEFSTRARRVLSEVGIISVDQILNVTNLEAIFKHKSCGYKTYREIITYAVELMGIDTDTALSKYKAAVCEMNKLRELSIKQEEEKTIFRAINELSEVNVLKEAKIREQVSNITELKRKARRYDSILAFAEKDK